MKKNLTKLIVALFVLGLFVVFGNVAHAQISANEAVLNATVDPNGTHTTAWFEYGTSADLHNWDETSHVYVGATNYAVPVTATLVNLSSNTKYYYRVVSDNSQNITKGNILSFNTSSSGNVRVSRNDLINPVSGTNNRTERSNLSAGPIFGTTSMPNTLFGWLVLILIIICIVVVIRKLTVRN